MEPPLTPELREWVNVTASVLRLAPSNPDGSEPRPAAETIMNATLRNLPIEERMHLVEDLWDSIAADQNALPLRDAQRIELDRRLDAYEMDRDPGRPAEAALQDIRKRL